MQRKVLIVDGPDCTGKSTWCKTMGNALNLPVYHLTYFSDKEAMQRQFDEAVGLIRRGGVILDRYIFSNIAYGNVYHNGEYIDRWQDYLNGNLLKDAEIVFTLPADRERYIEFYRSRFNDRVEMYPDIDSRIYDEYARMFDGYGSYLNIRRMDLFDFMDRKPSNYESTLEGFVEE